jgi:hypothetical protein
MLMNLLKNKDPLKSNPFMGGAPLGKATPEPLFKPTSPVIEKTMDPIKPTTFTMASDSSTTP